MRCLTRLFKILFVCFLIRGIFRISKNCVQVKIPRNFFKEVGCLVFYLPASGTEVPLSVPCPAKSERCTALTRSSPRSLLRGEGSSRPPDSPTCTW